jgi:glycosyltransferase involved in cell wall biosynthesis
MGEQGGRLRVTIISKAFVVGAYQTKLEEIARASDIALTAVVPASWREGRHEVRLQRAHTQGYRLIVAPLLGNGSYHLHLYPTLSAILRETRPDLCHIDEEPYNLATYAALRAARGVGAKALFFTWQNLTRRYPWPFSALERYVYQASDAALAGSAEAAQVLRDKGYRGALGVIPQFGVDPVAFHPLEGRAANNPPTIGYAGRLVEEKGLFVLVEALAGLAGAWRLALWGQGPLRQELEARLRALGLAERVTFYDYVPSTEMPRHLAALDMLVLPSLTRPNWKEQFGRVLLEAMACGVPVVGSASGEIPRVIGEGGLLFPEGDAVALRQALATLLADAAQRRILGQRGRARVLEHFTQARIAAQTVAFYREVMRQP